MVITVSKQIHVNKLLKRVARKLISRIKNILQISYSENNVMFSIENNNNVLIDFKKNKREFEVCYWTNKSGLHRKNLSISDLLNEEFLHSCDCKNIVKRTIKILAVELQKEVQ